MELECVTVLYIRRPENRSRNKNALEIKDWNRDILYIDIFDNIRKWLRKKFYTKTPYLGKKKITCSNAVFVMGNLANHGLLRFVDWGRMARGRDMSAFPFPLRAGRKHQGSQDDFQPCPLIFTTSVLNNWLKKISNSRLTAHAVWQTLLSVFLL